MYMKEFSLWHCGFMFSEVFGTEWPREARLHDTFQALFLPDRMHIFIIIFFSSQSLRKNCIDFSNLMENPSQNQQGM